MRFFQTVFLDVSCMTGLPEKKRLPGHFSKNYNV
jgi:hypothetical protein